MYSDKIIGLFQMSVKKLVCETNLVFITHLFHKLEKRSEVNVQLIWFVTETMTMVDRVQR